MNRLTQQSLLSYTINLLKPYYGYILTLILRSFIVATVSVLLPFPIKLIIDKAVGFQGNKPQFLVSVKSYVFLYILLWGLNCASYRVLEWVKFKLFPALRQDVLSNAFAHLNLQSYQYFQDNFSGNLINKVMDIQSGIIEIISVVSEIFTQLISLGVAVFILCVIHPLFAFILIIGTLIFLFIIFLFLKPLQQSSREFAEARSSLVGRMVDSISNIANVRLFSKQQFENNYINNDIIETVTKSRALMSEYSRMWLYFSIFFILLLGVNMFSLVNMYSNNLISLGDFTFITAIVLKILSDIWVLSGQALPFSEHIGKCRQALGVLNSIPGVSDRKDAKELSIINGEINFRNVSFHYDQGVKLFNNINIRIPPGQKTGLVGFSGSGKSTFVNLILRLFDVQDGEILIDNQNIFQVTQSSLRENIVLIPQDISLFHRSLMENIRYGNTNADDGQVIEASKMANCHEFIMQLKDGYQSLVGERGIKLSTGQRQRIAIARAILKNSKILILDEATSALDSITEKYIQESLYKLMRDKTTLVIAHRLSTLLSMDRILVFNNGEIIENGTHEELMSNEGHYAAMWKMQAGGFLPL